MNKQKGFNWRLMVSYLLPVAVILIVLQLLGEDAGTSAQMTHNELVKQIESNNVASMISEGNTLKGVLKDEKKTTFSVTLPSYYFDTFFEDYIKTPVEEGRLEFEFSEPPQPSPWVSMLPDLLFMGLMLFFFINMIRRTQAQNNGMNQFAKSRARLNRDDGKRITFADVAGLQEEKAELSEIVDFLKNPRKFVEVGARIPKGVLLVGPPGTGKTYLSKAVAGEAGVPFFSISGSDFVEMFVGVGASRVRDLFEEGKKNAPCIIFIDEIDAVGRRRGAGLGGGNDEREQTLNQLLVEMDGFDVNEGIIIMAATNRPDILDPAILRPGRFDRQVLIGMPDRKEREAMIRVHLRNKKIAEDVDIDALARQTAGFTPADIENMANEAALLTARKNEQIIDMKTFEEASIKVVAGPEKKSRTVVEAERRLTAYHEAGHAIVTRSLPDMDAVNLITIVPRGSAGGFTSFLPDDDRSFLSKKHMQNYIATLLGGRAAEEVVLDDISTGASNDIERATGIARNMVVKYGMSDTLGPIAYEEGDHNVFLGNDMGKVRSYSEKTAVRIDEEIYEIVENAYQKAKQILIDNRTLLENVAAKLLEIETLRREEFEALFQQYAVENQ